MRKTKSQTAEIKLEKYMTTLFNQANAPTKGSKNFKKSVNKKIATGIRAASAGPKYKTPGSKKKSPMTPGGGMDDSQSNETQMTINFDIDGRVYEEDQINIDLENEEYYRLKNEFNTQNELEEIKEEENLNYDTMEKEVVESRASKKT